MENKSVETEIDTHVLLLLLLLLHPLVGGWSLTFLVIILCITF